MMLQRLFFVSLSAAAVLVPAGAARADLDSFMRKPEPAFKWEKRGERMVEGVRVVDLHLVSQVWQGITWEHRVLLFVPEKPSYPHFCALYNTGGSGGEKDVATGAAMARRTGALHAMLFNIPNQPLYGGKTEDALVVHSWLRFMETGDESWPLHFPMAKAVIKCMDAIQAYGREAGMPAISDFLIYGASKRGWTTWLAGATRDPRIKAIAPMVIDVLNLPKQGPHQIEAYGKPSEEIDDYTEAGIQEKLRTAPGRRLIELEDPYSYRDRLTLPKLLILGTNDRYWTQDALNLYWDDLKGPKWVLYTPNSGHGLEDRDRVHATLAAFIRTVAGGRPWPRLRWSYAGGPSETGLTIRSDVRPVAGRLFHVEAPTQDFRDAHWSFEPMERRGSELIGRRAAPASGYAAVFGEAVFEVDGERFTLSTQIRILSGGKDKQ